MERNSSQVFLIFLWLRPSGLEALLRPCSAPLFSPPIMAARFRGLAGSKKTPPPPRMPQGDQLFGVHVCRAGPSQVGLRSRNVPPGRAPSRSSPPGWSKTRILAFTDHNEEQRCVGELHQRRFTVIKHVFWGFFFDCELNEIASWVSG